MNMPKENRTITDTNQSLNNYQNLFNSIPDLLFVINTSGIIIDVNQASINELAYAPYDIIGKHFDFVHNVKKNGDDNCPLNEILAGDIKVCNMPLLSSEGNLIPVTISFQHIEWNGKIAMLAACKVLSETENIDEKYSRIFQNTPTLSCIIDLETGFLKEVNKAFLNKLGFKQKQCIGKKAEEILKIDAFETEYIKSRLIAEGSISEVEIYITSSSNNRIPVIISSEVIKIDGKDHFYVIAFDVTQRKIAQRKTKETEGRYRELFKNMDSGFSYHKIISDNNNNPIDSIIVDVNPKFERLTGLYKRDIINRKSSDVIPFMGNDWLKRFSSVLVDGEPFLHYSYSTHFKKHFKIWIYRPKEGYLGIIYTDETSLKESEIKLKQQSFDIKKVIKSSQQQTGQDYYNNMVLCLNEIVKADYTYIGFLENNRIRTNAFCVNGEISNEVTYFIENTPCEQVVGRNTKVFNRNVQQLFPDDDVLVDMQAEAYVGTPIFDDNQNCIGIIVSIYKKPIHDTEFTETLFELFASSIGTEMIRTQTEQKLLESKQRYKWLSEATFEGIIITKEGRIVDANEQIQSIFGVRLSDLKNGTFQELVHPNDYNEIVSRLQERDISPYRFRGITQKGETIYLDVQSRVIELNKQEYRLSVLRDITKQLRNEQKIIEREQLLKTIFDSAPVIMMILDSNTNIIRMNKFGLMYIGKNESDFKGQKCGDFLMCIGSVNDTDGQRNSEICKKCLIRRAAEDTLETGIEHYKLETDLVTSINDALTIKTFLVSTKRIDQNNNHNVLLALDDITQRKQMEEELVESNETAMYNERRYKLLTDLTFEGIVIHRNGEILNVNKSFVNMIGYSNRELVGIKFISVLIPLKYQELIEQKLKEEYSLPYEIELICKDGTLIPVEIEARYFYQNDDKTRVTAIRDISERKEAEKRILNAILETEEKERASFAQELHDGLGPVLSNVQMYFQWLAESDENREFVSQKGNESLKSAFSTLREISRKLSPHILQNFGLVRAIETFINQVPEKLNLKISLNNGITDNRYTNNIEITLYRVVTELINNTVKYAQAKNIDIDIRENKTLKGLIINYKDDGKGIDLEKINNGTNGFGMKNIQSRIKTLLGNIIFNEDQNSGFNVSIIVPIKENE